MSDPNSSKPTSDNSQLVIHDEAYDHYSKPIPDRWRFITTKRKNGSEYSYYLCPETRQRFFTYEDLMRYVHYAEVAMVSIYDPYFLAKPRKGDIPRNSQIVAGPSSEMPDSDSVQGEEDASFEEFNYDPGEFDIPEIVPTEEELNSIPNEHVLPPMDSIILLPFESEKKEQEPETGDGGISGKPGFKNKMLMEGFGAKGKRKLGKRRESNNMQIDISN